MWKTFVPSSPRLIQHGASLRSRTPFDCMPVKTRMDGFDSALRRGRCSMGYCATVWREMGKSSVVGSIQAVYKPMLRVEGTQHHFHNTSRARPFTKESLPSSRSYYRFLSSKNGEEGSKEESNEDISASPNQNTTDPVLAEYLAGRSDSAGGAAGVPVPAPRRRKRKIVMIFEDEKELYKKIHRNQLLQKERSRQKTAASVNRALIGNVVICCGTFVAP
jgi:hypothetical protein